MPPAVIADSDDDSDERVSSAPPSPNHTPPVIDAPTRSSDGISHATVSTDPAFFQSIFNEQKDAANQRTQVAQEEGMIQGKSASSGMSGSTAGKAAAVMFTPFLVASATKPVNPKYRKVPGMISMNGSTSSRNDPTTSKQTAASGGVWDVPSSPERRPMSKSSKKKSGQPSKTTTVKVTRGLRKTLERLGYQSADEDDEATNGDKSISTRDKKRRRLDTSGSPRLDPNDANLNTVPNDDFPGAGQGNNNTASGALVATVPADSDSSFLVGPRPLSASQKLEYQSISLVPSSPPIRHPELGAQNMASSGTATNVNTPRSNLPSSHDVGLRTKTPENEALRNTRRTGPPRQRRDSSPDVLVYPRNDSARARTQLPTQSYTKDTVPDGIDGAGEEHETEFIPKQEDENDDSEFAIPEKPAQPKRQRGRPRKSAEAPDTATSRETGNGSTAEPKKKRGRPKKPGPAGDVPAEAMAHVTKTADEVTAGRQVEDGDVGNKTSMPATAQDERSAPARQDWAPAEKARQTTVSSDRSKENQSVALGPTTEEAGVGTKNGQEAQDHNDSRRSSRPEAGAKPVYRVGLSKRGKVAPLLKSLRK